jgi:hypothetical protein
MKQSSCDHAHDSTIVVVAADLPKRVTQTREIQQRITFACFVLHTCRPGLATSVKHASVVSRPSAALRSNLDRSTYDRLRCQVCTAQASRIVKVGRGSRVPIRCSGRRHGRSMLESLKRGANVLGFDSVFAKLLQRAGARVVGEGCRLRGRH